MTPDPSPSPSELNAARALELTARGRELWRQGKLAAALSLYNEAAALDPDCPAALLAEQARAVIAFHNTDLLNP